MNSFANDYACQPHPAVMETILAASKHQADSCYGEDGATQAITRSFNDRFCSKAPPESAIFFVSSGTAANQLALRTLLIRPYQSVVCTDCAHINTFECGAGEGHGYKLLPVPHKWGKIDIKYVEENYLQVKRKADIHQTQPRVISISNPTEYGTVYSISELKAIKEVAFRNGLLIHWDGARLANAIVHLGENPQAVISTLTPDALTLGATKNGGLMGDLVWIRDPENVKAAKRIHKQQGQLAARMWFFAAQFDALLGDGLWLANARQSNGMAKILGQRLEAELNWPGAYPVESNAVFVFVHPTSLKALQEKGFNLPMWDESRNLARFMCSWNTTTEEVEEFIQLIKSKLS